MSATEIKSNLKIESKIGVNNVGDKTNLV